MPKVIEPMFKHAKQEEIYNFLADNEITYAEAAKRWGYSSPAAARYFLIGPNKNKTLEILEDFEEWKQSVSN
jgi:hypothetical protein